MNVRKLAAIGNTVCIVINDKSQGSVAYTFIAQSKNWGTFGKVTGKMVIVSSAHARITLLSSKMLVSADKLNNLCITDHRNCY